MSAKNKIKKKIESEYYHDYCYYEINFLIIYYIMNYLTQGHMSRVNEILNIRNICDYDVNMNMGYIKDFLREYGAANDKMLKNINNDIFSLSDYVFSGIGEYIDKKNDNKNDNKNESAHKFLREKIEAEIKYPDSSRKGFAALVIKCDWILEAIVKKDVKELEKELEILKDQIPDKDNEEKKYWLGILSICKDWF